MLRNENYVTDKIKNQLFGAAQKRQDHRCYVILDAAKNDAIYERLKDETGEGTSLFEGKKKVECARVAPYLIRIYRESPFTHWLFEYGWHANWGIFFSSGEDPDVIKKHFRNFLMVFDENERPLYFRFYDPAVFRNFLISCHTDELKRFFGPVDSFFVKNEKDSTINQYRLKNNGLSRVNIF